MFNGETISEQESQEFTVLFNLCQKFFFESDGSLLNNIIEILENLKNDFGGNNNASLNKAPRQWLSYYYAQYDNSKVQRIQASITVINNLRPVSMGLRTISRFDPKTINLKTFREVLDLLARSKSNNWSAGGVGGGYFASLNNRLVTAILISAGCGESNLPQKVEKYGHWLHGSLQAELERMELEQQASDSTPHFRPFYQQ